MVGGGFKYGPPSATSECREDQLGFDLTYQCVDWTPMILMLNVHPSRAGDLITPDWLRITPARAITPSMVA
jgi:hypothetical protein